MKSSPEVLRLGRKDKRRRVAPSYLRCAVALLTWLLATAAAAQAERSNFEIAWNAHADCAPKDQVARKLRLLLGADPETVLLAPLYVTATIARGDARPERSPWQVELIMAQHGEARHRVFDAPGCSELADAIALLVALAIDPNVRSRSTDARSAPKEEEPPPATKSTDVTSSARAASSLPSATRPERAAPIRSGSVGWRARYLPFVGLGAGAEFGLLPHVGFGGHLLAGVRSRPVRLGLLAVIATSKPAQHPNVAAAQAEIVLTTLALRPCWMVPAGPKLSVGPCGAIEVGMLWGRGRGLEGAHRDEKPWGSARIGLDGEFDLGKSFFLVFEGDLGPPFGRPTFQLGGAEVYQPGSVVGSARLTVELHF